MRTGGRAQSQPSQTKTFPWRNDVARSRPWHIPASFNTRVDPGTQIGRWAVGPNWHQDIRATLIGGQDSRHPAAASFPASASGRLLCVVAVNLESLLACL